MSKLLLNSLLVSPAILGAALAVSASAFAAELNVTNEVAQAPASQTQALAISSESATTVNPVLPETSAVETLAQKSITAPVEVSSTPVEPAVVAQAAPVEPTVIAQAAPSTSLDQINRYSREGRTSNQIGQVTSVSQLSDVRPTDWAFQALQSLVERYGCIAGYPDRKYRGNQAMTRYEFAAGLNACMDRVNELIAAGTADLVKKEDLAVLQRLQEEFAAELATLRGRVDALEARTATLEKQQFSTTTKLAGEVIFAVTDEFSQPRDNETVFQNRVRLALNTSFTGRDLLVTRLAAGNATKFNYAGSPGAFAEGLQTFNIGNTGNNQIYADWVAYFFPLGEQINVYIPAVSGLHYDYVPTNAGLMEAYDSGNGPLSAFAQRNPIYSIGGGSGIGLNFGANSPFKISLGYLADNTNPGPGDVLPTDVTFAANNPSEKSGLFNGNYSALAQLTFSPSDAFSVGLTYVNAYRQGAIFDGGSGNPGLGTLYGNNGLQGLGGTALKPFSTNVNAYGISAALKLNNTFSINAFGALVEADDIGDSFTNADIWTYGVGLAIADFGKKGNLLGLMAGIEPYVANPKQTGIAAKQALRGNLSPVRDNLPFHFEAFYKYQLTDNISITPGAIYILNPGQNDGNDDIFIGTLRTTFTF